MKSFESRLTIFLSYSFMQRARTRARSFQCLYTEEEEEERSRRMEGRRNITTVMIRNGGSSRRKSYKQRGNYRSPKNAN